LQHGRELRRDQCLSCGGGIGVAVHQRGRDHGKDGHAHPTCQWVADSGRGRQIGDERIARAQLPPQHIRENRRGEVVAKQV
jgi:hypothetical protein